MVLVYMGKNTTLLPAEYRYDMEVIYSESRGSFSRGIRFCYPPDVNRSGSVGYFDFMSRLVVSWNMIF